MLRGLKIRYRERKALNQKISKIYLIVKYSIILIKQSSSQHEVFISLFIYIQKKDKLRCKQLRITLQISEFLKSLEVKYLSHDL